MDAEAATSDDLQNRLLNLLDGLPLLLSIALQGHQDVDVVFTYICCVVITTTASEASYSHNNWFDREAMTIGKRNGARIR